MAVFPILKSDGVVQVGDQIRLSAASSFITQGSLDVERVEIKPEDSADFVDVTHVDQQRWFLDWIYDAAGVKNATLKITQIDITDPENPVEIPSEKVIPVRVVTAADDYLFSSDQDLVALEPDVLRWIPEGYSSWNHVHRQAQRSIMDWLDEIRFTQDNGTAFTAKDLVSRDQVRRLSTMTALRMIYSILSNQVGDVFLDKANEYRKQENNARNRNYLTIGLVDTDGDGLGDTATNIDLRTVSMVRR